MRSDLQIEASRVNGAKSRGPITEEGKTASSRNALKHGMLSDAVLLYGENEDTFHAFNTEFIAALQPANPIEKDLADTMAIARWRRMRTWHLEKKTLEIQMERENDKNPSAAYSPEILESLAFSFLSDNSRALDLINRYESRYDRQYHRAFRSLLALRKNPQPTPPAVPEPAPVDAADRGPAATSRGPEPAPIDAGDTTNSAKRTQADRGPVAISRSFFLPSFPKPVPEPSVFRAQGGLPPSR